MTKAQTAAMRAELELLLAGAIELDERIDAGLLDDAARDDLATDFLYGASSLASFAAAVAA